MPFPDNGVRREGCNSQTSYQLAYVLLFVISQMMLLSQTTIGRITAGQVINIVSNDVQRLNLVRLSAL